MAKKDIKTTVSDQTPESKHQGLEAYHNYRRPTREANPLLSPARLLGSSGKAGVIETMIQSHMRIATRVHDVTEKVSSENWLVVAPEDAIDSETRFTNLCSSLLKGMRQDVENRFGNLGGSLGQSINAKWFGHWVAEMSLYEDPSAEFGARLEVFEIHVSTIEDWRRDGTRLTGVVQRNIGKSVFIPVEDLVIVTYGGPFPTGTPRLRPAVFWYEAAKQTVMSYSEQARAAAGLFVVKLKAANSQAQMDKAMSLIVDFQTEDGQRGVIIGGATGVESATLEYPTAIMDPTTYLSYFDGQIDQLMNNTLQSLGLTAGTGSRALGETLTVSDDKQWRSSTMQIGKKWGDHVFAWIAKKADYKGRLPTLQVEILEQPKSSTELIDNLVKLVNIGVMTPVEARQIVSELPEFKDSSTVIDVQFSHVDSLRTIKFETPEKRQVKDVSNLSINDFAEMLHEKTGDELMRLGLRQWDDGLWLFPKEWFSYIPNGFLVIDIFGAEEFFDEATADNDHRYGVLAYGVLEKGVTSYVDPDGIEQHPDLSFSTNMSSWAILEKSRGSKTDRKS